MKLDLITPVTLYNYTLSHLFYSLTFLYTLVYRFSSTLSNKQGRVLDLTS